MQARIRTTCQLLRVIDGDTILVRLECPCCRVTSERRIRLARIDAPEIGPLDLGDGIDSKEALKRLLEGKTLEAQPKRTWPDKYGRVVAEVWANGRNVSDWMLEESWAAPWPPGSPVDPV